VPQFNFSKNYYTKIRVNNFLDKPKITNSVVGINVSRQKEEQETLVHNLVLETAAHLGRKTEIPSEAVVCFGEYVGPGYSVPTSQMVEAVKLLARTEAILLEPVYTEKAMAGLIDLIRKCHFNSDETILFYIRGVTFICVLILFFLTTLQLLFPVF
jgi:1-aminocyclopropane-1-carboxylate deaminase/D-cysteine desulfhydrase-like pyridoxal-dependent ACC family enzyme